VEDKFVKRKGLFVPKSFGEAFPDVYLFKELHDNQTQFWASIPINGEMINLVVIHDLDSNGELIKDSRRYAVVVDDFKTKTTKIFNSVFNREEGLPGVEESTTQASN
jgi:hypothetical protein